MTTIPTQYRYALTPRSDLLDLCPEKPEPIAYFRDELAARTCGLKMYGCYHEISDILAETVQGKTNVED